MIFGDGLEIDKFSQGGESEVICKIPSFDYHWKKYNNSVEIYALYFFSFFWYKSKTLMHLVDLKNTQLLNVAD